MDGKKVLCVGIGMAVCALAGAGLEHVRLWLFAPEAPAPAEEAPAAAPARPRVVTVKDGSAARDAEALRKRVAELEQALAARATERVQETPKPQEEQVNPDQPKRQSREARMEQLKKEDPVRYAEMQKRFEDFRQSMEQRAQEKSSFLAAVDTQAMTDEQRANHEQLVAAETRISELRTLMMQAEGNSENRDSLRQEMGETMASLGALYDSERQYLLQATARAAGYEGEEAATFSAHIQTIIQNTSMGPGFGFHGGRGPGGGR
ncbi:MAG TPA: hypothetical protein PKM57_09270 [Kiritimatiellia bacterium]|nr:hypothetical protein [Kiritimatiellia bacterium]HPS07847.1 hypothetical protein [Kiritimatiellia bacterium]